MYYARIENGVVKDTAPYIDGIWLNPDLGGEWVLQDGEEPIIEVDAQPTQLDIIEAQVMYTALMTDTLIDEV